jgi:hypothetical protein
VGALWRANGGTTSYRAGGRYTNVNPAHRLAAHPDTVGTDGDAALCATNRGADNSAADAVATDSDIAASDSYAATSKLGR